MTALEIDVSDAYFWAKPSEVARARRLPSGLFAIESEGAVFLVRRIRVVGRVSEVRDLGRAMDFLLSDEEGSVPLRAWEEKRELLEGIKEGDLVDVLATIRSFGEQVYLSPVIVRKADESVLERWRRRIPLMREYLKSLAAGEV